MIVAVMDATRNLDLHNPSAYLPHPKLDASTTFGWLVHEFSKR